MTERFVARVSRLGFAAVAFAAMNGSSLAQDAKPAATTAAVAGVDAAKIAKGRDVFSNYGCGGCHSLADAGATGHVGPSFDGDSNLSEAFVNDRVTNGQGPMPAFGSQMQPDEIAAISYYVAHAASK